MAEYPYEKLGLLYLGRELDLHGKTSFQRPLLYKNKDMTTHGAIIGMTGSGKTGLGVALIEEAIMDNVPSIIIDPKGDMGNLLLTFPECRPEDFMPWIDPAEAARKEMTVEAFAGKTAQTWKDGLASWDQGLERIATLRKRSEMTIYTPGSSAGVPVSVLHSFAPPAPEMMEDIDTLNSLVNSTATSLLALVDVTGDPLQSREHILLSSLLLHFWRQGQDLSMEALIGNIVNPPFEKVGVFPLDAFYPQPQRMTLAMSLNNILASPTFGAWTQGEPLDIQRLLYTEEGLPRTAIFSIAHLSDTERMFFVTMLLNRFIGWMRRQQGSSSLKALVYMDEIFGYFPPTANPPSKKPMLLMLKQARAFGIGVVLSTQNPVDLDYKGLSNIGTWFVGRLQTRQDQDRVIAGIVGASDGNLDPAHAKTLLSDLKTRQFLLTSAHLDEPLLFETRWVMSYLKGPITKNDIKKLMAQKKAGMATDPVPSAVTETGRQPSGVTPSKHPPVLSGNIPQLYHLHNVVRDEIIFEPWLVGKASVRFYNAKRNIEEVALIDLRHYLDASFTRPDWASAEEAGYPLDECVASPPPDSGYYPLPPEIGRLRDMRGLEKEFSDYLYQNEKLELLRATGSDFESKPGESEGDFRARLGDWLREQKDAAVEKLKKKYQNKQEQFRDKLDRAMDRLDKEKVDVRSKTADSLISFGVAIVGAFLGRKALSAANVGRAASGVRGVGRVAKEKSDVRRAEEEVLEVQQALENLAAELENEAAAVAQSFAVENYPVERFSIKPRRADIFNVEVSLLWEMDPR